MLPPVARFSKAPLALPTLALAAGIVLYKLFPSVYIGGIMLVIALGLMVVYLTVWKRNAIGFSCVLLLLFGAVGNIDAWIHSPSGLVNPLGATILEGTVENSTMTTNGSRSQIRLETIQYANGKKRNVPGINILLYSNADGLTPGDQIYFPQRLESPAILPFPDSEEYARRLQSKGIGWQEYVEEDQIVVIGKASGMHAMALRCRDKLENLILDSRLKPGAKGFVTALVTGDRKWLNPSVTQKFADVGIAHILALSGLHLAILASILSSILLPADLLISYKWRFFAIILLLWIFTYITGMNPSTVRACVMATAFYLDLILERPHSRINALFASAAVILFLSPYALFDIGFLLSISCVASIILFVDYINPFKKREHPRLYSLASLFGVTVLATTGSWLITASFFGQLPLLTLPANLIAVSLMFPLLLTALVYTVGLAMGIDLPFLRIPLDLAHDFFYGLAETIPNSSVYFQPDWEASVMWGVAIALLAFALQLPRKGLFKYLPSALCGICALVTAFFLSTPPEDMIVISSSQETTQIAYRIDRRTGTDFFARGASTVLSYGDMQVTMLQKKLDLLSESEIEDLRRSDLIILAGSFSGSLKDIAFGQESKPTIVVGPYLRNYTRKLIEDEASELDIQFHSLRDHGPLRLPLKPLDSSKR